MLTYLKINEPEKTEKNEKCLVLSHWAIAFFFNYWSCWLPTCMDHKRHHDNLNHALDDFIILWYFVPLWKYYLFVSTGIRCHFFHSSIHLLQLANVHESTAAVAKSVRTFVSHAECWMSEFKPRQTYGRPVPLLNARQHALVSRVIKIDHF